MKILKIRLFCNNILGTHLGDFVTTLCLVQDILLLVCFMIRMFCCQDVQLSGCFVFRLFRDQDVLFLGCFLRRNHQSQYYKKSRLLESTLFFELTLFPLVDFFSSRIFCGSREVAVVICLCESRTYLLQNICDFLLEKC